MVSQVHTITNNILVTIGSVKGIPGYNPLLTISHLVRYICITTVCYFFV